MAACHGCSTTPSGRRHQCQRHANLEFRRVARCVPVSRLQQPRAPAPVAPVAVVGLSASSNVVASTNRSNGQGNPQQPASRMALLWLAERS